MSLYDGCARYVKKGAKIAVIYVADPDGVLGA
jgi:hypothetical protein